MDITESRANGLGFLAVKPDWPQLELQETRKQRPGPAATDKSSRSFFGATYLFDAIGENWGSPSTSRSAFRKAGGRYSPLRIISS
ncbi:MAG: hypothetical protein WCG34_02225 [Leptolinea sp.]